MTAFGVSPSFSSTLNQKEDFECPICLDVLLPPVFMCPIGHPICNECYPKLKECPMCRQPLPINPFRNIVYENLTKNFPYPCKNKFVGCQVTIKVADFKLHEFDCRYEKLPHCRMLGFAPNCNQLNVKDELISHLFDNHPEVKVGFSPAVEIEQELSMTNPNSNRTYYHDIFYSYHSHLMQNETLTPHFLALYEQVFYIQCIVRNGIVKWFPIIASSHRTARMFKVKFRISSPRMNCKLEWEGDVIGMDYIENAIKSDGPIFCLPRSFLTSYSTIGDRGQLKWKLFVKIDRLAPHGSPCKQELRLSEVLKTDEGFYTMVKNALVSKGAEFEAMMIHPGVACQNCDLTPIVGNRFKCIECPNFNLCTECEGKKVHDHHIFLRISDKFQQEKMVAFMSKWQNQETPGICNV